MATGRSVRLRKAAGNSVTPTWVKAIAAVVLGAGVVVSGMFLTFETQADHNKDNESIQKMLDEIRGDVKTLLQNQQPPEHEFRFIPPYTGEKGSNATPDLQT